VEGIPGVGGIGRTLRRSEQGLCCCEVDVFQSFLSRGSIAAAGDGNQLAHSRIKIKIGTETDWETSTMWPIFVSPKEGGAWMFAHAERFPEIFGTFPFKQSAV